MRLLGEVHGLKVTEDCVRDDISDHLDYVAKRMRIGRQAAKVYVTDEAIAQMADRIAFEVFHRSEPNGPPSLRVVK
ncbi:hypothetical protein [Mycobacterium aquaticum]|uniref:hypothetical protein n=1 Tax=Mycobacterium aquaticum TaxID=1927124 RepID=UPI001FE94895|nr:hypothetical protein [Mycobacterium aquaticum]